MHLIQPQARRLEILPPEQQTLCIQYLSLWPVTRHSGRSGAARHVRDELPALEESFKRKAIDCSPNSLIRERLKATNKEGEHGIEYAF